MWRIMDVPGAPLQCRRVAVIATEGGVWLGYSGGATWIAAEAGAPPLPEVGPAAVRPGLHLIRAPMAGRIVQQLTRVGQTYRQDSPLVILEAMKMEFTVVAPTDGTVVQVHCDVDDWVDIDTILFTLKSAAPH